MPSLTYAEVFAVFHSRCLLVSFSVNSSSAAPSTLSQRRPSVTCSASIARQPGCEALLRSRGRGAPGSQDHVLRNQSVGSRCSVAVSPGASESL